MVAVDSTFGARKSNCVINCSATPKYWASQLAGKSFPKSVISSSAVPCSIKLRKLNAMSFASSFEFIFFFFFFFFGCCFLCVIFFIFFFCSCFLWVIYFYLIYFFFAVLALCYLFNLFIFFFFFGCCFLCVCGFFFLSWSRESSIINRCTETKLIPRNSTAGVITGKRLILFVAEYIYWKSLAIAIL